MTHGRMRIKRSMAALLSALVAASVVLVAAPASAASVQLFSNLTSNTVGYSPTAGGRADSFVVSEAQSFHLTQITFGMSYIDGSPYTANFALYDDAAGMPGTQVALLGSIHIAEDTSRNVFVTLTTDLDLAAGQRYWLVVTGNGNNGGWLLADSAPSGHSGITAGPRAFHDGAAWQAGSSPYFHQAGIYGEPVSNPTATISAVSATPTNANTHTWEVRFSRAISGLKVDDFNVATTGVTLGSLTLSPVGAPPTATWRVSATTVGNGGTVRLNLVSSPAQTVIDGLPVYGPIMTVDRVAPTTTILPAPGQSQSTNTQPISFDVNFSESVSGFSTSSVDLSGSTAPGAHVASISGSGSNYRVTIDGASGDGTVIARIPAEVVTDAAGNGNSASGAPFVTLDFTAPTPTISSTLASPTDHSLIPVSIAFDETTGALDPADITVTNARVLSDSGPGQQVTLELEPTADGIVTVSLPSGAVHDTAGNASDAAAFDIEFAPTSAGSIQPRVAAGDTYTFQLPNPGQGTPRYSLAANGTNGATRAGETADSIAPTSAATPPSATASSTDRPNTAVAAASAPAASVSSSGLFTLRTSTTTAPGAYAYTAAIEVDGRRFDYALDFTIAAAAVDNGGADEGGTTDGGEGLADTGAGTQAPLIAGALVALLAGAGALLLARRRTERRR